MSIRGFADRLTAHQETTFTETREETPRRFHIRRTAAIALLAVVVFYLPLGDDRLWTCAVLFISSVTAHAIHCLGPERNVDGIIQWLLIGTALACGALEPLLLPAAALGMAVEIAGGSRAFDRFLNYLWIAVFAAGITVVGLTTGAEPWVSVLATFVFVIPGSVELGAWRSQRSEIERRRMHLLSNLGQALTWEANLDEKTLLWVDGPVEKLLGYKPSEVVELVNTSFDGSTLENYPGENIEWVDKMAHADGTQRWFRVHSQIRTRADGARIVYGVSVDITELELARRHQQKRAEHDSLTGLKNRDGLVKFLDDEAHRPGRAVLVADIDRFKDINDTLGHLVGDQLIAAVAGRLNALATPTRLFARLGGDEFAIAIVGDSAEEVDAEADTVAVAISNILRDGFSVQDIELHVKVSTGIASGSDLDWTELLRRADRAMYDAKRRGGGHKWFDKATDGNAIDQILLQADLTRGLEDEIVMHYQPVVSATTHEIVGVEALARWQHPERGMLFPDTFIPIIDKSGMTSRFDLHVLRTAVATASELTGSGRTITVSVNLSPRSLWSPNLLVQLRELLAENPLARERIVIEVTEQGFQNDFSRSLPLFESLQQMGVRLSLDDFGTGGSSLIRLRSLPFDEIKIDRSFVDGVPGDGIDATIVKSTIELAGALGMSTVAEGVETLDQAHELADMGCRKLQGWAFAKAMPLDELIETWVRTPGHELADADS